MLADPGNRHGGDVSGLVHGGPQTHLAAIQIVLAGEVLDVGDQIGGGGDPSRRQAEVEAAHHPVAQRSDHSPHLEPDQRRGEHLGHLGTGTEVAEFGGEGFGDVGEALSGVSRPGTAVEDAWCLRRRHRVEW